MYRSYGKYSPQFTKVQEDKFSMVGGNSVRVLTRMVADAARGSNVLVNAVDPGWVRTQTGGLATPRSIEQGTDTIVWLATLPNGGPTGGFFHDRQPIPW